MKHFARRAAIETAAERIALDHRRGASALADAALAVLLQTTPSREQSPRAGWAGAVLSLGARLAGMRPSMPVIENAVRRALVGFPSAAGSAGEAYRQLGARVRAERDELRAARGRSAARFADAFETIRFPLVYSSSENVMAALCALERPPQRVSVCESRPLLEGRRVARVLSKRLGSATAVELITDARAGLALQACDAFVTGCDAVFADGSVANKSGTAFIAGAARRCGVPVIVVGDSYRFAARSRFKVELHPAGEVWLTPARGVVVRNVAFETVASTLVHRIVIEEHVLRPGAVRKHWNRRHARVDGEGMRR